MMFTFAAAKTKRVQSTYWDESSVGYKWKITVCDYAVIARLNRSPYLKEKKEEKSLRSFW